MNTVQGNARCLDCERPIMEHDGQQCPRFSIPARIRAAWAAEGNRPNPFRPELPWSGCPCAKHRHG